MAPEGYKILDESPSLESEEEKQSFIGKIVLVGWDSKQAEGWFLGTVHSTSGFTRGDLQRVPTANFVVKYNPKLTDKKLNGNVAHELSARTYGAAQWWVQVEKDGSQPQQQPRKKQKKGKRS